MPRTRLPVARRQASELPDSSGGPDLIRDALWTYAHLDHPRVVREEAPSEGAWSLLSWARDARHRFFEQVLPKAIGPIADSESNPPVDLERVRSLKEELASMTKEARGKTLKGVPEAIQRDVTALLAEWREQTGVKLSDDEIAEIHVDVCQAVRKCARVVAGRRSPSSWDGQSANGIEMEVAHD